MNRGRYRKLWAILGAGVLTLGVVSVALALELKEAHRGVVIGWTAPAGENWAVKGSRSCCAPPSLLGLSATGGRP